MSDHSSQSNALSGGGLEETGKPQGPIDAPQGDPRESRPTLADLFAVRQNIPIRHLIPDVEVEQAEPAQREIREAMGDAEGTGQPSAGRRSLSIMQRRMKKFKSLRRGYYSFIILVAAYVLSFLLPLLVNNQALIVHYNGSYYFPALADLFGTPYYPGEMFGVAGDANPADFRALDEQWEKAGGDNWIVMPLYPWDPFESDYDAVITEPTGKHLFGTDDTGRDVLARMCYGFNVSISFSLILTLCTFVLGAAIGGVMGYYGGKFDLFFQRAIEIWLSVPSLFVIIIVSSIIIPNFMTLVGLLVIFGWMGMTFFMRGEFYREKAKDYVAAAISLGATDREIIFKHILPNSLTPIIASFPFAIIGGIFSLVGLDYLGYGLPPPTPSWGQMVDVGLKNFSGNFQNWWLVLTPICAMFATLLLVTFIGEAIREAFDPKVFSRLR